MESTFLIMLGVLLLFSSSYPVEGASLSRHFRSVPDVEFPSINITTNVTAASVNKYDNDVTSSEPITKSSPSSLSDKLVSEENEARKHITFEENIKKSDEEPNKKTKVFRGSVKFEPEDKDEQKEEKYNYGMKTENMNENSNDKEPAIKGSGRSLNFDIEKYISPEFHNKNNVFTLPTSPDIERYLDPDSQTFTETSLPKRTYESTKSDFRIDLTTPHTDMFDSKYRSVADGIKQNLDEIIDVKNFSSEGNEKIADDEKDKYSVYKLIDNVKNVDNDTEISLHASEYKNLEVKSNKNEGNKDVESGINVDYKSSYAKTLTFEEKPDNLNVPVNSNISNKTDEMMKSTDSEKQSSITGQDIKISQTKKPKIESNDSTDLQSTAFITSSVATKKPRIQFSFRNNTIETTASESEIKPKNIKHFSSTSDPSSLDPLYETEKVTYTRPAFENAINITKRGSIKNAETFSASTTQATPKYMDYDSKNFSIPPTATAWTLAGLKEFPSSSIPITESTNRTQIEEHVQENQLINVQLSPPTRNEQTTTTVDITNTSKENLSISTNLSTNKSINDIFQSNSSIVPPETTPNNENITLTTKDDFVTLRKTTDKVSTSTESMKNKIDEATEFAERTTSDELIISTKVDETTLSSTEEPTESTETDIKSTAPILEYSTTEGTEIVSTTTDMFSTTHETLTTEYMTTKSDEDEESTSISDLIRKFESSSNENRITEMTDNTDVMSTTILISTEESTKDLTSKTETENELYTTSASIIQSTTEDSENIVESAISDNSKIKAITNYWTTSTPITAKTEKMQTLQPSTPEPVDEDIDNNFDVSEPEIEIIPMENSDQTTRVTVTTRQKNIPDKTLHHDTTTLQTTTQEDTKSVLEANETENTTTDSTSSTELLSDDDENDDSSSGKIAAIAISAVGGVCLIMLAGLLLIMRKRQKRITYGQRCRPVSLDAYSLDNVSVYNSVRRKGALRASKRSYGNPAFDDPVSISHQMNFQSLAKFVDNVEGINAEYEEIPQVTARASEVPSGCEMKNRYANVIPLPETRVFLKATDNDPHSDYINANYVTGPKNTRGYYIACQAPMQSTVDDFWRMIWEQQSRVIIMLTNLYENGVEKCADYLPPSEVLDCHRLFGDFQITLKKREVKEKYIISSLQLKNMVSNSWREVTHLWYLGWPERGIPTEANSLIAFLIEARSHLKAASNNNSSDDKTSETACNLHISGVSGAGDGGPMVVHCSPGTGRTGTVIACDIAIRDFELTRTVDVPKIVYRVRRNRASAVQTREQYGFIYKVISLYATKLTGGALDSI